MTPGDDMGPNERAWLVAGLATVIDPAFNRAEADVVEGEVIVACLPAAWAADPERREAAYAAVMIDLVRQRVGWLGLVRRIHAYSAHRLDQLAS